MLNRYIYAKYIYLMDKPEFCPNCSSRNFNKAGIVKDRQRYRCKACNYYFTVSKKGRSIDDYYVNKALQLYLEGLSYREIERLLGVSHVSVSNWVKHYRIKRPGNPSYHPTYKIVNHTELQRFISQPEQLKGAGFVVTELGDKFMLIRWERFRE